MEVSDASNRRARRSSIPLYPSKKGKKLLPTAVDLNGFQFKFRSHCTPPLLFTVVYIPTGSLARIAPLLPPLTSERIATARAVVGELVKGNLSEGVRE